MFGFPPFFMLRPQPLYGLILPCMTLSGANFGANFGPTKSPDRSRGLGPPTRKAMIALHGLLVGLGGVSVVRGVGEPTEGAGAVCGRCG